MNNIASRRESAVWFSIVLSILLLSAITIQGAEPTGPEINVTKVETVTPWSADTLTTVGGSIATIQLNGTTQNPHWKAFVGNVTGTLTLDDASNQTIYDWNLANPTGEVYVSRNAPITWSNIQCANLTHVSNEEDAMNHTAASVDSISNTFSDGTHKAFYTADEEFTANECSYSTYTYVNSGPQSASFSEILLSDGSNLVYATVLEDDVVGFDLTEYDFQMIVAEKGWAGPVSNTPYYLYVELT